MYLRLVKHSQSHSSVNIVCFVKTAGTSFRQFSDCAVLLSHYTYL